MSRNISADAAAELTQTIQRDYESVGGAGIARRFGIARSSVNRRAAIMGVRKPPIVNVTYFDSWSPNMAWMLGYIWADGTIQAKKGKWRLVFGCVADDRKLIEDIRTELKCLADIRIIEPKLVSGRYNCRVQVRMEVNSKEIVEALLARGIVPDKSNVDPPMPFVPDEYLNHFTRGVIDGDGSFSRNGRSLGVTVLGTHRFIESMRHRVSQCSGVPLPNRWLRRDHANCKLSVVRWSRLRDVLTLIRWLYPSGEYLFLSRKRSIAQDYVADTDGLKSFARTGLPKYRSADRGRRWAVIRYESQLLCLGKFGTSESLSRYEKIIEAIRAGERGESLRSLACTGRRRKV